MIRPASALLSLLFLAVASERPALAQLQLTPQVTPQTPVATPTRTPRAERPRRDRQQTPATDESTAANSNFPRRLTQKDIRTRFFDGEPINARGRGGASFVIVFHPDGRMERTSANGDKIAGKWHFLGDAYCSRWEGETHDTCYTVVQDGEVIKVVLTTRAIATWSKTGTPPLP